MVYTECGLYSVVSTNDIDCQDIMYGLENLQHRGRESFGISFVDNQRINIIKKVGLVSPVIGAKYCTSKSWLGHVRYSTSGPKRDEDVDNFINVCQPINYNSQILGNYSIAHNGNIPITTFDNISKVYKQFKIHFPIQSDTVVLRDLIEHLAYLANRKSRTLTDGHSVDDIWKNVLTTLMNVLPGACCLVIQTLGSVWIFRDRYGLKPLSIKKDANKIFVSSESVAFRNNDNMREINPGEIAKISMQDLALEEVFRMPNNTVKSCVFEQLYFLRPGSIINGITVENFRHNIGFKIKEQLEKNNIDLFNKIRTLKPIVCGVPSSGVAYGKGFSDAMELQYVQFINKRKNYPWRTFILESNDKRIKACQDKYVIDKDVIENNDIVIVDDSIVRGNTLKYLIKYIKMSCNVKSIHIVSGTPQIKHACHYGVDFPDIEELFANNVNIADMPRHLDVDSVTYLDVKTLHDHTNNICDACFTGKYMF